MDTLVRLELDLESEKACLSDNYNQRHIGISLGFNSFDKTDIILGVAKLPSDMQIESRFVKVYETVQTVGALVHLLCPNSPRLNAIMFVVVYGFWVDQLQHVVNAVVDGILNGASADRWLEAEVFVELAVEVGEGNIRTIEESALSHFNATSRDVDVGYSLLAV